MSLFKAIEELRTTKSVQIIKQLGEVDEHGYESRCALGVICEAAMKDGVPLKKEYEKDLIHYYNSIYYDGCAARPPKVVLEWLFSDWPLGWEYFVEDLVEEIVNMNDKQRLSFDVIAKELEEIMEVNSVSDHLYTQIGSLVGEDFVEEKELERG